jgi:hypothetical protein
MTRTEVELISLIYGLYAYECIHWLKPQERAFTRSSTKTWKTWKSSQLSFTLLNRRPCLVNVLPSLAGFAKCRDTELTEPKALALLQKINRINRRPIKLLNLAASIETVIFLLIIPLTISTQHLRTSWIPLLTLALLSHAATVTLFWRSTRSAQRNTCSAQRDSQLLLKDLLSISLNPLSATRSGDLFTQRTFESLRIPTPNVHRNPTTTHALP